ncbi:MAG: hypothetical protein LBR62_03020 [Puniceicoccales bacterium]|nr:hypothetical protein [Puniceicoccales bacterium]
MFSLFFYGWWNWHYLFILGLSGLIDFFAALAIDRCRSPFFRRGFLYLSLLANLGLLGMFKYFHFSVTTLNSLAHKMGINWAIDPSLPFFFQVLPVGISFYTFQSMSYTIDVYRRRLAPTCNVLHFFSFLALFPQLVAGPIERASNLLCQLARPPRRTNEKVRYQAFCLILVGYLKKMLLADRLAPYINGAFASSSPSESCFHWWIIMAGFGFQIYGDFSGYSDIARGLASWMGYSLQRNFRFPYFSCSLREFWARWHISLSSWFRDYVYIPLGGNRCGSWKTYRNLWITMVLSGLWHGSRWNFVFWGVAHAFLLSLERFCGFDRFSFRGSGRIRYVAWAATWLGPLRGYKLLLPGCFSVPPICRKLFLS